MDQHAIVIADQHGVIRHWSDAAVSLFGHPPQEAVGQKLDLIVPESLRGQHWRGFDGAMKGGPLNSVGQFFDLPIQCRDGETRNFRGQLHVLRSENDGPIGAMAIFTQPA